MQLTAYYIIYHPYAKRILFITFNFQSGPAPKIIPSSPQLQQEPFLSNKQWGYSSRIRS